MGLQKDIDKLAPWHYNHVIKGVSTGDSLIETTHLKLQELLRLNVFSRKVYPRVLDLGANSGLISQWFVDNKDSKVDAIEYGPKYYKQLEFVIKEKEYEGKIIPIYKDISKGNFGKMEYDLILYLGTMHHIPKNYHLFTLKECHKTMIPGAEIVVQTHSEILVGELLEQANFINITKLQTIWNDRDAWVAIKDPMKVI